MKSTIGFKSVQEANQRGPLQEVLNRQGFPPVSTRPLSGDLEELDAVEVQATGLDDQFVGYRATIKTRVDQG